MAYGIFHHTEIVSIYLQIDRTVKSLQEKWKNVKKAARRRDILIKKAENQTGGGTLTPAEKRIVESQLYADIVTRMGVSARGNPARFDNDNPSPSGLCAPSIRLQRALSSSNRSMSMDEMSILSTSSSNIASRFNDLQLNRSISNEPSTSTFQSVPETADPDQDVGPSQPK